MKTYTITEEKNLPESEFELSVEVAHETLTLHRTDAVKKLSAQASIPGFRPGHIPENILVQKIGELAILEEAAYAAVEEVLPDILKGIQKRAIGDPRIDIKKLAPGNPLVFTLTLSIVPEITLPDYKKIAATENGKKAEDVGVSQKEVNDFIDNVRKGYTQSTAAPEEKDVKDLPLPELTDEFVKKLGEFADVADFTAKVKENLRLEKEHKAREKRRLKIAEAILDKVKVAVPKALVESELAKLLARFHDDVTRMGMKMEDYLKHIKKTEEEMRKEWRPDAEKRGKLQLVWDHIAEVEKITPPEEAVAEEVKHMLEHYTEADPIRTRAYVAMMMTNDKVFEFLENQK